MPKEDSRSYMTDAMLRAAVLANVPEIVVVTGGEPALYRWEPFCEAFLFDDIGLHLETSGSLPIFGKFDWITLSPKRWGPPLAANLRLANEIKIIVESPEDIDFYLKLIEPHVRDVPIWLHPEWSKRNSSLVLDSIVHAVKHHPRRLRAGWQVHKQYKADAADPNSKPPVPLGGKEENGF